MAQTPQIILIDGPAGAGKTTLALKLQTERSCQVVHLDSVYNGWEDALTETLTQNLLSLINAFKAGLTYELPIYNWEQRKFVETRTIRPDNCLIIEGVGSGQSAIRDHASSLYWVEVDEEIGLARVLARDGDAIAEEMRVWKVREAEHFKKERTREFADFIITTT